MMFAVTSLMMLLIGGFLAGVVQKFDAAAAGRFETVGGGLLAIGLMLVGMGIHSSFS